MARRFRYPIATGAALFFAASPALAQPHGEPASEPSSSADPTRESDRERLRDVEREVEILKRKLEVQEEDTAQKARRAGTVGAADDRDRESEDTILTRLQISY